MESTMRRLARNLGEEWKALATYLGVRRDQVDRIQADNRKTEEQIFHMLMTWWDNNGGDHGALDALCAALRESDRKELAESLGGTMKEDFNINVCRAEFIRYYEDAMGVVSLLPWLPSEVSKINDIYVKLKLIEKENKAGRVLQRDIDSYEDVLRLKYHNGQPVRFILLSGIAGSGKTTIVSKIASDWTLEIPESPLSNFSLLVALSMRELKSIPDLTEAIFDQILPRDTEVSRESLRNYLKSHSEEVLVILDGADEFDKEGSQLPAEGDVIDIISNKILRGCTVIVTTRPHMVDKLCRLNPRFARVETHGFSESGVKEYIEKFFNDDNSEITENLVPYLKASDILYNLARIPMMLLLMCLVWSDEHQLPQTLTELFKEAVFFILNRHFQKFDTLCQEDELLLENDLKELVQALGKSALDGLMLPGQKLVFKTSDLGNSRVIGKACSLGILSMERVRSNWRAVQHVTFLHKTFQEAIAGFYLASLVDSDKDSFNRYRSQINKENAFSLEYVLRFCCGANVQAARSLLTHITDVFSRKNPEMLKNCKKIPESIIWKAVSPQAKTDRLAKRLWLLMHLEAQSDELHNIASMYEQSLEFDFNCAGDERVAFGFLVECASNPSLGQSFLAELKQVAISTINENSAPVVGNILRSGVNVRDVKLVFGQCENDDVEARWQVDLGEGLGKMQVETLSLSGPFATEDHDVSAIFERLGQSDACTSLQSLTLTLVGVNPRYIQKFLEKQGKLRQIFLRSQDGNNNRQVWNEPLEGLQTQSLEVLDVRHYKTDSSAFCFGRPFPNLRVLKLIDACLQEEDFQGVGDLLSKAPRLQEIDISRNEVGRDFPRLVEQLRQLDHLEVLRLTDCGLVSDQVVLLASNLHLFANLRVLSLSRYEYSPKSVTPEALLTVLHWSCKSSSLRDLDIKQCVLKNHGAGESNPAEDSADGLYTVEDPIQETHHQSTIENLDFSSNHLGRCTPKFIRLLSQMPSLKNLDMSSMGLTYSDALVLAEVLQGCPQLQKIHLGDNNKMGSGGLEVLLRVLPELPELEYISLPDKDEEPSKMVQECLKYAQRYSIIIYFHEFNRSQIEAAVEIVQRYQRDSEDRNRESCKNKKRKV